MVVLLAASVAARLCPSSAGSSAEAVEDKDTAQNIASGAQQHGLKRDRSFTNRSLYLEKLPGVNMV
jgi:hypothetical protein